jgi:hypothetical protein
MLARPLGNRICSESNPPSSSLAERSDGSVPQPPPIVSIVGSLGSWDCFGVRRLSIVCMSTRCRFLDLVPTAKYLDACHDSQRVLPIVGTSRKAYSYHFQVHVSLRGTDRLAPDVNITTRLLQYSAFAYDSHRPCPTTHSMQVVTRLSPGNLHGASSLHTQPADRQTFAFTCSPLSRHVGRTWLIRNLCLSFRGIPPGQAPCYNTIVEHVTIPAYMNVLAISSRGPTLGGPPTSQPRILTTFVASWHGMAWHTGRMIMFCIICVIFFRATQ